LDEKKLNTHDKKIFIALKKLKSASPSICFVSALELRKTSLPPPDPNLGQSSADNRRVRIKVRHGKVRVIRLNKENPKTLVLLKVLKTLDQETRQKPPD